VDEGFEGAHDAGATPCAAACSLRSCRVFSFSNVPERTFECGYRCCHANSLARNRCKGKVGGCGWVCVCWAAHVGRPLPPHRAVHLASCRCPQGLLRHRSHLQQGSQACVLCLVHTSWIKPERHGTRLHCARARYRRCFQASAQALQPQPQQLPALSTCDALSSDSPLQLISYGGQHAYPFTQCRFRSTFIH
jgi:hypothetical protein